MRERVLIADDDPELLDAVAAVVAHGGRVAVKARDGGELLEAMARSPFDLVITDISMPWMTGLPASCSARYAGLPTPILVITALDDASLPEQVATLGDHTRLLRKPLDIEVLERAIEELLAHRPREAAPAP